MTLAQAVLEIFCSQASYIGFLSEMKRERFQKWIVRLLPKVDQVIYILGSICDINSMTLAEAVLEIFCSQAVIKMQKKLKRAITLQWKNTGLLNFYSYPPYQISSPYLQRFLTECKCNTQTVRRTGPTQLLRSWGHKKQVAQRATIAYLRASMS